MYKKHRCVHNKVRGESMKNMMIGLGLGMASGALVSAYCLTSPDTKKNANKMLNKAMDNANMALDDMKNKMK